MKRVVRSFVILMAVVGCGFLLLIAGAGLVAKFADPPIEWCREELRQAAAVRFYGAMLVSGPACGVRSNAWAWQLLGRIQTAIPPGRDDLSDELETGKNQGFSGDPESGIGREMCAGLAVAFRNADRVIGGAQGIFDPVRYDG